MPKSAFRFYNTLIITSALILGSYFSLAKSALAAPTAPGSVITNTATGSFEGESSGTLGTVTSNTVTMTVLEVAGITAVASGNTEAPLAVANAGSYQDVAGINTGDVVYFDFTITNAGNDPTQFFIPGAATITGGTLENIQVIAVDPDGAGAVSPTTLAVTVPGAGNNTVTLLGATNGYIPQGGTVTVRVAVKVTETIVGNSITVLLGDTTPNDNSAATQNQVYAANGTQDIYTVDLANNAAIPTPYTGIATISQVLEATGNPVNGDTNHRQEASAKGSVSLAATPVVSGYKSVRLMTDADASSSVTPGDTLTWRVSYANTDTVDVPNFQITDALPSGVALSGTLAATNITIGGTQLTAPLPNTTYNGIGNNTLFASGVTLKVGGVVTINIPVTVNAGLAGGTLLSNQPTANSLNVLPVVGVKTDNIDNATTGLPTGVTAIPSSITQTQTAAISPTTVTTAAPIVLLQTPLVCDGRFYQIRATSDHSELYLINRFNNPFVDTLKASTPTGTVLNGLAYNPVDNFMYALFRGTTSSNSSGVSPGKTLYRIDSNSIVHVGNITNLPNGFAPTAADFGPDGSYYVTRAGGSTELYKINIATQVATPITMNQNTGNIGDMAYNPTDGYLYGIGGTGNQVLFKIDPVNGNVTTTALSLTDSWGTAFFDPVGTFYGYANSGNFYRIDITTGTATLLSTASSASVSDGATCQFTSEKIDTVKSVGVVTKVNATTFDVPYTIRVKNTGSFNAPNVQITENLNRTFSLNSPTISLQVAPVATGGLTINPAFDGITPPPVYPAAPTAANNKFNLLTGLNSLAAGTSGTITFTVRLVYPNATAVPTTVLNNQVYASTITSTTAPGTANPGYTFPSNVPVPPPDLLTADTSTDVSQGGTLPTTANGDVPSPTPITLPTSSNPNVLLVKRITAINGSTASQGGDDLSIYNNDTNSPYDDNTNAWPDPTVFLKGGINGGFIEPGKEVEYTIYFLSAGNDTAQNVLVCDRIPPNTAFVSTAFNTGFTPNPSGIPTADRGIVVNLGGTIQANTNVNDGDVAQYFPAGVDPTTIYPTVSCGGPNTNGAVVVNLGNLPSATAPGNPSNYYGHVRFRVIVQ
jgi:uncharacterized repeat protein (TIGR01451 family)